MNPTLHTSDGLALEAEWAEPDGTVRARAVLCHPHPQHGGTMRSLVISELFRALPGAGVACLRFNYRGVEHSEGSYGEGVGERLDVLAALDTTAALDVAAAPVVLVGWSFGADMALSTFDDRIAGWVGIAAPLRFTDPAALERVGADPRPKALVLAAHDEFRPAEWVRDAVAGWQTTHVHVVPGASHFFVGRTDRVVAHTLELVDAVTGG